MKKIITLASLFLLACVTVLSGQGAHAATAANVPAITGILLKLADGSTLKASQKGTDFTFDLVGVPDQAIKEIDFTSPTATKVSFVPFDDPNYSKDTDLTFAKDSSGNNVATLDEPKFIAWYQRVITSDPTLSSQINGNQIDSSMIDQLFTVQGFRDAFGASGSDPITLYLQDADGNTSPEYTLTFLDEGWKTVNGKTYYYGYDQNGLYGKYNGWQTIAGKRYFFNRTTGELQNGLIVDGKYKYYDVNGKVYTGWVKVANKWYFFDKNTGAARTGWLKDGTKWYYLNGDGTMATGWVKVANKWYYLNSNGAMATGWVTVSNKRYYLNSNGSMATGWVKVSGKWYYLYSDGHMAVNTVIGKHKVGKTGTMLY